MAKDSKRDLACSKEEKGQTEDNLLACAVIFLQRVTGVKMTSVGSINTRAGSNGVGREEGGIINWTEAEW